MKIENREQEIHKHRGDTIIFTQFSDLIFRIIMIDSTGTGFIFTQLAGVTTRSRFIVCLRFFSVRHVYDHEYGTAQKSLITI